ncbi:hypothetical protein NDU88_002569 [Pleurodeles waltl]|uniref:Uncharacterized protein n=1 Tax=Pleurodeles waltl TaxID=8319 RepID=A0AAV7WSR2_PLEWA|nr:hypothetical protein NDU88_002569 [Pleurodeles waltl]
MFLGARHPGGSQKEEARLQDRISQPIEAAACQFGAGLWCFLRSPRHLGESERPPARSVAPPCHSPQHTAWQ